MGDQEDEGAAPVGGKLFELSMTDSDKKGFIAFYRGLPKNDQVVRFFDRKEYYSVHGDAAEFVARTFYRTTSVIKTLGSGDNALQGVTLNRALFETVLRQLLLEGSEHTVEIWEEQGKSWQRTRVASPGQLLQLEDILFRSQDMEEVPILLALKIQMRDSAYTCGVAFLNPLSRELGACEVADDAQLTALEGVLVQLGARECVVPREASSAALPAGRRLRDVLGRCGILVNEQKDADFNAKDVETDLSRLLSGNFEVHRQLLDRPAAASALAALIRVAELAAEPDSSRKYTLSQFEHARFMRLDASASRALNVTKERGDAADTFSLYKLLNRAKTPMGKRLLLRWLHQPLLDLPALTRRLDVVEALSADPELRELLRGTHLRTVSDVERLTLKLERRKATLVDLCKLYQASIALPQLADALRGYNGEHAEVLHDSYAEPLERLHAPSHLGKFEQLIETAVDVDRIPDEYVISAAYDDQLGELAADRERLDAEIEAAFAKAANDLGLEKDKVLKMDSNAQHGWFLRLTKKEETQVRKQLENGSRYLILEHRKDGTKFTTPALKSLSAERLALDRSYQQQQRHLVEKVVDVASSFCDVLFQAGAVLAELDVLAGFADLAACAPAPYVRPTLRARGDGEARIVLEGSRHPCVEVQDGVNFVPNDCRMERGSSWFHVITGPNMGGKSTFIRQVGVCVLMAQVGCFVPAAKADISLCDAIFCRVGAGDCQLRGISTFMAEMLETASILKAATPSSLIIIDELGRGTSTYDGFGLAWAISEHIAEKIQGPCLFATHFHELTALRGSCGVANYHVEAAIDQQSRRLTMLYALRPGACDESFGIHCAEFARFPASVLEAARAKAAELEGHKRKASDVDGVDGMDVEGEAKHAKKASGGSASAQAEASRRARAFLREFAALPLAGMPRAEAQRAVAELRGRLGREAEGLPALRAMMTAA